MRADQSIDGGPEPTTGGINTCVANSDGVGERDKTQEKGRTVGMAERRGVRVEGRKGKEEKGQPVRLRRAG